MTVHQGYETKQNNFQPQHTTKVEWQGVKGNSLRGVAAGLALAFHVTQNIRGTGPEKNDIGISVLLVWNECGCGERRRPLSAVGDEGLDRLVPPRSLHGQPRLQSRVRRREDHVRPRVGSHESARSRRATTRLRFNATVPVEILLYNAPNYPENHGSLHGPVRRRQVVRRAQAHAESRVPLGA